MKLATLLRALAFCCLFLEVLWAGTSTSAFPTPFIAQPPLGSLIYDQSVSGTIANPSDVQAYTVPLTAGQTITVDVTSDATLQATITLTDPGGNTVGTASAAAPGKEVLLQTVAAATAGVYTIAVAGVGTSTGQFTVGVTLNAALDSQDHGGAANTTVATAQDLSASSVVLPFADRLAVLGAFEGSDDFYAFDLSAGLPCTVALTLASNAAVSLNLEDANGNVLATGTQTDQNVSSAIHNFVAPADGTYYVRLTGSGTSSFSLIVTRGADFERENNDDVVNAQILPPNPVVLADIGNGAATPDDDWYAFSANAGDNLVLAAAAFSNPTGQFVNNLTPLMELYDNVSDLNLVATGASVVWTALESGTYLARVTGASNTVGEYVLSMQGATAGVGASPQKGSTKTTVASGSNPSVVGQSVTISFTVTPGGTNSLIPGGTVTVQATTGENCMATLPAASCILIFTTTGSRTVTASYGGDGNFNASGSAGVTQNVGDFTISATPPSQTISSGHSAVYTITLASVGGLSGNVALSCSGRPPHSSCTVSPGSVALGGTATAKVTLFPSQRVNHGTFTLMFTGNLGTLSHSTNVSLTVK